MARLYRLRQGRFFGQEGRRGLHGKKCSGKSWGAVMGTGG
jgi:hypothetical protein